MSLPEVRRAVERFVDADPRWTVPERGAGARLAELAEGFSGAELEQAVVSALYAAHADQVPLSNSHLLAELRRTRPLSVVMAEKVDALREWARGRTVLAD